MASNSGENDLSDSSEDKAPGASHSRQTLLQKISLNTEMKLSWADQLEELDKDGVSVDQKVIISGPEKPSKADVADEAGRKDHTQKSQWLSRLSSWYEQIWVSNRIWTGSYYVLGQMEKTKETE